MNVSKEEIRTLARYRQIGGGMIVDGNHKRRIDNKVLISLWKKFNGTINKTDIVHPAYEIHEIRLVFNEHKYISFLLMKQKKDYSNGVGAPRSPFHGLCTFEITRSDF